MLLIQPKLPCSFISYAGFNAYTQTNTQAQTTKFYCSGHKHICVYFTAFQPEWKRYTELFSNSHWRALALSANECARFSSNALFSTNIASNVSINNSRPLHSLHFSWILEFIISSISSSIFSGSEGRKYIKKNSQKHESVNVGPKSLGWEIPWSYRVTSLLDSSVPVTCT